MQYDSNTAKVDRWHGLSQDELAQGYGNVEEKGFPETNNERQVRGGTQKRDDSLSEQSD